MSRKKILYLIKLLLLVNLFIVCPLKFILLEAQAKHVIVSYDTSGSMYKLREEGKIMFMMDPADFKRLNNYLIDLLYSHVPEPLDSRDKQITNKLSQNLLQPGDRLSFFTFNAEVHKPIMTDLSKESFVSQLPGAFPGQDSDLYKAIITAYELYKEGEETVRVTVSDEDYDISVWNPIDPIIMEKINKIQDKYHEETLFHLLIKDRIQLRAVNIIPIPTPTPPIEPKKPGKPVEEPGKTVIYIASTNDTQKPIKKITLLKDKESGNFKSKDLVVITRGANKKELILEKIKFSVITKEEIVYKGQIPLKELKPPYKFTLTLPDKTDISEEDKKLDFLIRYKYKDEDKEVPQKNVSYHLIYPVPLWPFIIILLAALAIAGYFLFNRFFKPSPVVTCSLEADDPITEKRKEKFVLEDGETLGFIKGLGHDKYFDVDGKDRYLKNSKGKVILCEQNSGNEIKKIADNHTFEIKDSRGNKINITFSILKPQSLIRRKEDVYKGEEKDPLNI